MLKRGNRTKASRGPQSYQLPIILTSLVLIVVTFVLLYFVNTKNATIEQPKKNWSKDEPQAKFHPTVEFRNGTDVIWQIPSSSKAVLFLAHGCNGRAGNFWDKSPNCRNCVGLPEERLLVLNALARNFAIITISSAGRCWTLGEERLIVKDIIGSWLKQHGLEKLPLVALGASSGGYFVSVLATDLKFNSIVLMIAEGVFEEIDVTEHYPPILFMHMPKDSLRQQKVREYIEVLKSKGIDVAEIECLELPLSPSFLADRIPSLDPTVSTKLFELFQEKGFIDKKGYMKRDGRRTRWKEALHEKNIYVDETLVPHVQEELNLAFAYHEMTSVQSEQIFRWFESHMKTA